MEVLVAVWNRNLNSTENKWRMLPTNRQNRREWGERVILCMESTNATKRHLQLDIATSERWEKKNMHILLKKDLVWCGWRLRKKHWKWKESWREGTWRRDHGVEKKMKFFWDMSESMVQESGAPFDPKAYCHEQENLVALDGLTNLDQTWRRESLLLTLSHPFLCMHACMHPWILVVISVNLCMTRGIRTLVLCYQY